MAPASVYIQSVFTEQQKIPYQKSALKEILRIFENAYTDLSDFQ